MTVEHTKTRRKFNKTLAEPQSTSDHLADPKTSLDVSQILVHETQSPAKDRITDPA